MFPYNDMFQRCCLHSGLAPMPCFHIFFDCRNVEFHDFHGFLQGADCLCHENPSNRSRVAGVNN